MRHGSSPDALSFSNMLGGSIIVAASSKTALMLDVPYRF
jgi:hypothetical protein